VRSNTDGKNPGAYVAEPKNGFKESLVSFDANSLYPNVMISLNLSPETKIGKVEKTSDNEVTIQHVSGKLFQLTKEKFAHFVKQEELALTKAGFLFTQKKQGIIPEFLDYYYNERVKIKEDLFVKRKEAKVIKDKLAEIEKQLQEIE
jgi:DNA polymerase elongation subunit (family B)